MAKAIDPLGKETRTISDLGLGPSEHYAQNRENTDSFFLKDSQLVSSQAKITGTTDTFPSELDAFLLSLGKIEPSVTVELRKALFCPPPGYRSSRSPLFAEQLIPRLGSLEKQDTLLEKLKNSKGSTPLVNLLTLIHDFNELLIDFNSKRVQYQRG